MNIEFMEKMQKLAQPKPKGKLVIISGMSGCGKTTIADILRDNNNYAVIGKFVTRPFRKTEMEQKRQGKNPGIRAVKGEYNDGEKDKNEQEQHKEERELLFLNKRLPLSYENYGNYYGFSTTEINNYLEHMRNVAIIVNDIGIIKDLKKIYKDNCVSCYVYREAPKSKENFLEIARQRGDTIQSAETRYERAQKEWDRFTNNIDIYDYTILNTGDGTQKVEKMLKDLNLEDFKQKQEYKNKKQGKPLIYVLIGDTGSGKDEALKIIRVQSILHSIIMPKHTTRNRQPDDGEEMICIDDTKFDMGSCDIQYENYGTSYGINTRELQERLADGISSSIVVSNQKAIEKLKEKFHDEIVTIYIHGLSKEEYVSQQQEHLDEEYIKKRIEEYGNAEQLYYKQWLDIDHVVINNGNFSDLKIQLDTIMRCHEHGRDLSIDKFNSYVQKANKYISRFAQKYEQKEL